jgi:hypothetical protein
MPYARPRCGDCRRPLPPGDPRRAGLCGPCKRLNAALTALHHAAPPCPADGERKRLKVELYACVVACGGRIFEGGV